MQECRPVSTPLPPNNQYLPETKEEALELKKLAVSYQSAIGSINYLSKATRPNLSHAIISKGLIYFKRPSQGITAYSNADWGNCRVSQQSVLGYLAALNGCLVLWKTQKQPSVYLSTTEAEYKALCDLTSKLLWLGQWEKECCLFLTITPIVVHEDNQSCINAANGDSNFNNKCMKHVKIQLHFIKEVIFSSAIQLSYTLTYAMLADFLTTSVPRPTLSRELSCLSVVRLGVRGDVENHLNKDQDDQHS
ncbi:hypothetical protein O181_022924 [Austropuccinia psidii MF-1]|uniref:Uncharacterized protein n=1 Tax=Austropuccinia psidii MF-1 TaxID=1389203 RepID=A0A9Q3CDI1_9BASI|nr:hypothetical protein [Austropuccinia psidii MF-1]